MDELIDIVDKQGNPTGVTALKSEVHQKGWYHNTVHLWLFTTKGEVLLQQRSHKKAIYPLLWDVSVAGHIDAGEDFKTAAVREAKEEIGLNINKDALQKIGIKLHEGEYNGGLIKDNEFHHIYIAELQPDLSTLKPDLDEVEAIKLVSIKKFYSLLDESDYNSHFVSTNKAYYEYVLKAIQSKLNQ